MREEQTVKRRWRRGWVVLALGLVLVAAPVQAHRKRLFLNVHLHIQGPGAVFWRHLQPYGTWVYVPPFGYCWRPWVAVGWRPYFYGHWLWTHDGWFWVSYEPFGWIVYHYGRWFYHPVYGWLWVPGFRWGPAWVVWVIVGGSVGWAPLPPPGWSLPRLTLGVARPGWHPHAWVHRWVFVPAHALTRERIHVWIQKSVHLPGTGVHMEHRAPDPAFVKRFVGRSLKPTFVRKEKVRHETGWSLIRPRLPASQEIRIQRHQKWIQSQVIIPPGRPILNRRDIGGGFRKGESRSLPQSRKRPKYKRP